jgi:hypothetical protein
MLRMVNPQRTLWESILPAAVLGMPAGWMRERLAAVVPQHAFRVQSRRPPPFGGGASAMSRWSGYPVNVAGAVTAVAGAAPGTMTVGAAAVVVVVSDGRILQPFAKIASPAAVLFRPV